MTFGHHDVQYSCESVEMNQQNSVVMLKKVGTYWATPLLGYF